MRIMGIMGIMCLGTITGMAQTNYAVRWLSMDAAHEFNSPAGCPTNHPIVIDNIGTNVTSPFPNRAVVSEAQLRSVQQSTGAAFANWYQSNYLPAVAARDASARQTFTNKLSALSAVMDDLEGYRARWQAGQTVTIGQANLVMSNLTETILRLKPVIRELYRGD